MDNFSPCVRNILHCTYMDMPEVLKWELQRNVFQIIGSDGNYVDGATIRLYQGWGDVNQAGFVQEVIGDDFYYAWGRAVIDLPAGAYIARISKEGYDTVFKEIVIDDKMHHIIIRPNKQ